MKQRVLSEAKKDTYFSSSEQVDFKTNEGTKELGELFPFIVSGGTNTKRYYFKHINDATRFKFNIRPEYFVDESAYTEVFLKRIQQIQKNNMGARIFCVYDMDSVFRNPKNSLKNKAFTATVKEQYGDVELCPSMPCIEYWFLLHYINHTGLLKNYSEASQLLSPYFKSVFPDSAHRLKKLLKSEKYLKDAEWVKHLCSDGKLEKAICRAEENISKAIKENDLENQSYSYVFKIFKYFG